MPLTPTAVAMIIQVAVTPGHNFSRPEIANIPWTAQDTADAEALRNAYEARPVGSALSAYKTRIYWRESEHNSAMRIMLLKISLYPPGDFLVAESHRPVVFDGGCSVVQSRIDASGLVSFACNGYA